MSGVGVAKVAQILDLCNFIPQMELKGHRIMIRCPFNSICGIKRTSDHDP